MRDRSREQVMSEKDGNCVIQYDGNAPYFLIIILKFIEYGEYFFSYFFWIKKHFFLFYRIKLKLKIHHGSKVHRQHQKKTHDRSINNNRITQKKLNCLPIKHASKHACNYQLSMNRGRK